VEIIPAKPVEAQGKSYADNALNPNNEETLSLAACA
jgi:hypothetical protein